jgi:hypothetical protein
LFTFRIIIEKFLLIPVILLFCSIFPFLFMLFSFSVIHFSKLLVYQYDYAWFFLNFCLLVYSSCKIYTLMSSEVCGCFSTSSVCMIYLSNICNASLMVMKYFSLCLSWKVFISPLILKGHLYLLSRLYIHHSTLSWLLEFLLRDLI